MIDVTQSFLDEVYKTSRYVRIRGTLTSAIGVSTTLEEDDFVSGSIARISKAVGGTNFRIGDTHIDYLEFSLGIKDNPFNNLVGSDVVLEYGIELAEDVYEWCKLGTFHINLSGVVRKTKTIEVTADSMLCKADKSVSSVSSGTPYDLANWACTNCKLELATSSDEFSAFANGNINLSMPDVNVYDGIKTYRDLLMWIANITCTFVTCDVDGKVVFKPYVGVPVCKINPDTIASKEFGDYTMNITNVTMSIEDKEYNLDEEASLDNTLALDENPLFINYVADALRVQALTNIRDELNKVQFVPFKLEFNGNPAIEVGDWITYRGSNYLVTSSHYKYKGKSTLQGVGLKQGNTKKQGTTTRGGTGGSGSGGGGGSTVDYLTVRYVNAKKFDIGSTRQRIFNFDFEVKGGVVPLLSVIVTCNITTAGVVKVILNYDNVDVIPEYYHYMPVGMNSLSFTFPLAPRDEYMSHRLYGYILSEDGVVGTIDMENVLARLSAWGLVTESSEWNGKLELNEEIPLFTIHENTSMNMLGVSESVNITFKEPMRSLVHEEVPLFTVDRVNNIIMLGVAESVDFLHYNAPVYITKQFTATQATLNGSTVLRSNSLAPDGKDLDYIGNYPDNGAIWTFELTQDTAIDLYVHAACDEDRYLDVYIDDILVSDNLVFNSGDWEQCTSKLVISGYRLTAGTHTIGVGKDTGSYAPIVTYAEIKYKEEN